VTGIVMRGPRTREEKRAYNEWKRSYIEQQTAEINAPLAKFSGRIVDNQLWNEIRNEVWRYCDEVIRRGGRVYTSSGRCINKKTPLVTINRSPSGVIEARIVG
jgi:hypothetical protein